MLELIMHRRIETLPFFYITCRPVYGVLLAQRIAAPQMSITALVTGLHVGICYLLVFQAQVRLAPFA